MNGILLIDKPFQWTSHDVVDEVRRKIGQKRVGHAGTLDPMATGLLVLLLGEATSLFGHFEKDDKVYEGSMMLGATTDTDDGEGVIHYLPHHPLDFERIREVFYTMRGSQRQTPPLYSAVSVKGKRLYELARKGVTPEVEIKSRLIEIFELDLIRWSMPDLYFRVTCSKGTYVRSLCRVIGEKIGCGAFLSSLRRVRSGRFDLAHALTVAQLREMKYSEVDNQLKGVE